MVHQISLTDFVDIVAASGTPKATKVRQVKRRPAYSPATDFYKKVRDGIVDAHKGGKTKAALNTILTGLTDQKKITAYPTLIAGYKKWWGKKSLQWFGSTTASYQKHGIAISVNPELGLTINGGPHLIKLYFKSDQLSKTKADLILELMQTVLLASAPQNTIMAVLDVRRSKPFVPTVPVANLAMVDAELAYIASLWPAV